MRSFPGLKQKKTSSRRKLVLDPMRYVVIFFTSWILAMRKRDGIVSGTIVTQNFDKRLYMYMAGKSHTKVLDRHGICWQMYI